MQSPGHSITRECLPHHRQTLCSVQGHSRRLQVCVKPVQHSGTLPLLVEAVLAVSIGCVSIRSMKLQRALDSYQVSMS